MDEKTMASFVALLGELIDSIKAVQNKQAEHDAALIAIMQKLQEQPAPKKRTRKAKKEEPAPEPEPQAAPVEEPHHEPEVSPATDVTCEAAWKQKEEEIWAAMKNDYGDDVPRPSITVENNNVVLNGSLIDGGVYQRVLALIDAAEDTGTTPADIAAEAQVALVVVYFVMAMRG